MATVLITPGARQEFRGLPLPIQGRVRNVFGRLRNWPNVSGVKALTASLAGNFRVRTGDYRVIFRVQGETVTVWKIGYRGGVYD